MYRNIINALSQTQQSVRLQSVFAALECLFDIKLVSRQQVRAGAGDAAAPRRRRSEQITVVRTTIVREVVTHATCATPGYDGTTVQRQDL